MSTSSTRLFLLWAYTVMVCLPDYVSAQTEPQKASDYCSVSYVNGCVNNSGLSSVQINNVVLSQSSGCSVNGYAPVITTSAKLTPGQTNTFAITLLDPTRPHGITIWADLNRNYSIDLGEDLHLSNGPLTGPISGTFTIPVGTASGPLRMRVLSAYNTMPFWPCSTNNGSPIIYEYGETEDYTVYVQGPITGLNTSLNNTGTIATLNWNSLGPDITYDVQYRQPDWAYWSSTFPSTTVPYNYLYDLRVATAYEWRVRQTGTETYSGPVSFTTPCATPNQSFSPNVYATSAYLRWRESGYQSLTVQWRPAGITDWTSVSVADGFGFLAGYSLTSLSPNTAYEWRVQGHCSGMVSTSFSAIYSFTTTACTPPYPDSYAPSIPINSTSVRLGWYNSSYDSNQTYKIQYRPVGAPAWQEINGLTTYPSSYTLTGLTADTHYEWQIQSLCSSTVSSSFASGASFTTVCPTLSQYSLSSVPNYSGARLSWGVSYPEPGSAFEVSYRPAQTNDWTTVSSLTAMAYSLTGLSPNAAYEWRVRAFCASGAVSAYSDIKSFTTACVAVPQISVLPSLITTTSAQLNWDASGGDANTRYEIRWRVSGISPPVWTTISNLTASGTAGSYLLTGLTNATSYEWQVRNICSPTESTSFTNSPFPGRGFFDTYCRQPYGLSSTPQLYSALMRWQPTGVGVSYTVRYMRGGTTDWTTITDVSSTSLLITGLNSNTQYVWQVLTQCETGFLSPYSSVSVVTTIPCTTPASLTTIDVSDISATVRWAPQYPGIYYQNDSSTRYDLRWRAVGASDWITISDLASASGVGTASLFGLTAGTSYEWQVRTICSVTDMLAFTTSTIFQTLPSCNGLLYTLRTGSWLDPGTWSCNRVPLPTDVVQVRHNVYLSTNQTGKALRVQFETGGKIFHTGNSRLRLGL